MIKRLLFLFVLSVFAFGCKAKRTAISHKRGNSTTIIKNETKGFERGIYKLPKDTGRFVRYNIESVAEYIDTFSEVAQLEMQAYGIPASITLAQGLLESGFGKGKLAMKANNHFGIKCHTGWKGDYHFHDDDEKGECFRKYNHPMYSYRDHSLFLVNRSRYAFLFDYKNNEYNKWAKGLSKAGYATDKKYPQKLISLIERYELYKFDGVSAFTNYKHNQAIVTQRGSTRVHTVEKGDTLYSLSRKYFVSVDALKRLNKLRGNTISIGQKLILKH